MWILGMEILRDYFDLDESIVEKLYVKYLEKEEKC